MCGNIGSGKTTLSKKYAEWGYVIISRDRLRYNIGAGNYVFKPQLEAAIWQTEIDMVYNFLKLGVDIFVDEVGVSREMRARYIRVIQARFPEYQRICIQMPHYTMKKSVDRRMQDPHGCFDRKIWEGVWKKFEMLYEIPNKDEGFHKIIKKEKII